MARQRNGIVSLPAPRVLLGLPCWIGQHASKAFRQCAALRTAGRLVLRKKRAAAAILQPELRRRNIGCVVLLGGANDAPSPRRIAALLAPAPPFLATSHSLASCHSVSETTRPGSSLVKYRRGDLCIGQGLPSSDSMVLGLIGEFLR